MILFFDVFIFNAFVCLNDDIYFFLFYSILFYSYLSVDLNNSHNILLPSIPYLHSLVQDLNQV